MKKTFTLLFSLIMMLAACSDDNGTAPDEQPEELSNLVWIESDSVNAQTRLTIDVYVENNQPLTGLAVPLNIQGEYFSIDSVSVGDSRFELNQFSGKQLYSEDNKLVAWFYPEPPEVIDTGSGMAMRIYLWVWGNAPTQDIIIDTTTIEVSTRLGFIDTAYNSFMPEFEPGILHVESIQSD